MVEIRLCRTEAERTAVYAFRYDVIVTELGIRIPTADDARHVVIDPEDRTAYIAAAYDADRIVGTVRLNLLADGPVEPHCSLLDLLNPGCGPLTEASVTSRLFVATSHRGGSLAVRLAQAGYLFYLRTGIRRDYILVNPTLSSLYVRLGYRAIGPALCHPEIGRVHPLRLDVWDFDHLSSIASVLTKCVEADDIAATDRRPCSIEAARLEQPDRERRELHHEREA